ncbi:MAG: hypothetical protein ACOX9R_19050 [Armatimonadota bacterium]
MTPTGRANGCCDGDDCGCAGAWPVGGNADSGPQIVGRFDEVDDTAVVLGWTQRGGAPDDPGGDAAKTGKPRRGFVGVPSHHVAAIIFIRGG